MYERFTDRARKVMQLASQEAARFNHEYIGTEHILLGLVKEGSGVAAHALRNLEIDLLKIRLEVEKIMQPGREDVVYMRRLPQTPRARKVIEYSIEEAKNFDHNFVGTEHLLLGLIREEEGLGAQVLMNLGLKLEDVREEVLNLLGQKESPAEDHCGRNLVRHWARSPKSQEKPARENSGNQAEKDALLSAERERIRSLERHLWNVRVVLGALVGVLAGALFAAQMGAVVGLIVGGSLAAFGQRLPAALAGGVTGLLLGSAHMSHNGGGLAGALLGALTGFLIAEIGGTSSPRK
jgi:hypothetical protein